ncbi:MAG: hypothetical protein KGL52_17100 [Rhodospirillales bacterium]|jgi:uncharacterized cupredoxin-like copper-binding protein|nr:hypothetical protein [Rhodospirillales bacterium]
MSRRLSAIAACAAMASFAVPFAARAATVKVKLEDMTDHGVKKMEIVATPATVKAGPITFDIKNYSKYLEHEMLVVKPEPHGKPFPYNTKGNQIIESKIDKLEDSGDLQPGNKVVTHVTLKPGKYVLLCNEPGHYKAGMWTWLHVKG